MLTCCVIAAAGYGAVVTWVVITKPKLAKPNAFAEGWDRITGNSVEVRTGAKSRRCAQNIASVYAAAKAAGPPDEEVVLRLIADAEAAERQPKDPTEHMTAALRDARTSRDFFAHRPTGSLAPTEETIRFFIDVYTNGTAKAALVEGHKKFPAGSVILKRKSLGPDGKDTQYFTGMRKNWTGYWPEAGDWEFFILDATGSKVEAGKLQSCADCHTKWPERDFVSRNYFDSKAPGGLKTVISEKDEAVK